MTILDLRKDCDVGCDRVVAHRDGKHLLVVGNLEPASEFCICDSNDMCSCTGLASCSNRPNPPNSPVQLDKEMQGPQWKSISVPSRATCSSRGSSRGSNLSLPSMTPWQSSPWILAAGQPVGSVGRRALTRSTSASSRPKTGIMSHHVIEGRSRVPISSGYFPGRRLWSGIRQADLEQCKRRFWLDHFESPPLTPVGARHRLQHCVALQPSYPYSQPSYLYSQRFVLQTARSIPSLSRPPSSVAVRSQARHFHSGG